MPHTVYSVSCSVYACVCAFICIIYCVSVHMIIVRTSSCTGDTCMVVSRGESGSEEETQCAKHHLYCSINNRYA